MTELDVVASVGWILGALTGFNIGCWVKGRWPASWPTWGQQNPKPRPENLDPNLQTPP